MARIMSEVRSIGATEMLREQHRSIKDLFRRFENAEEVSELRSIGNEILRELEEHTALEEKLFYPEARRVVEEPSLVAEALEAHHVVKGLSQELKWLPIGEERYRAKFKHLIKDVLEHIDEEETKLFPQVERSDVDLDRLGERMSRFERSPMARLVMRPPLLGSAAVLGGVLLVGGLVYALWDRLTGSRRRRSTLGF